MAYLLFFYNILLIALFLLCTAAFLLLWRRAAGHVRLGRRRLALTRPTRCWCIWASLCRGLRGTIGHPVFRGAAAGLFWPPCCVTGLYRRGAAGCGPKVGSGGAWLAAWPVCAAICAVPMTPFSTAVFYSLLACVGVYVAARGLQGCGPAAGRGPFCGACWCG